MAHVSRVEKSQGIPSRIDERIDAVTLELNVYEASTLALIFHLIGGSPDTSLRKHSRAMRIALEDAGIAVADRVNATSENVSEKYCSIYFKDQGSIVVANRNAIDAMEMPYNV